MFGGSVSNVGSGSDYAAFLGELGISSVDLRYDYNTVSATPWSSHYSSHLMSERIPKPTSVWTVKGVTLFQP